MTHQRYGLIAKDFPEDKQIDKDFWNTPRCPIYYSHEFQRENLSLNNKSVAVCLIQGKSSSKVGVWDRVACAKQGLRYSMLPYIDACRRSSVAVFVMNPNQNKCPETGLTIYNSDTPETHAVHVWKNYIKDAGFDHVHFVVQGNGGDCVNQIMNQDQENFYNRAGKIVYCEATVPESDEIDDRAKKWLK